MPDQPEILMENATKEEIAAYFANDRFATNAGCTIIDGGKGYGLAQLTLTEDHLNANGFVMGGAIMTLADFALAVACNVGQPPTVGVQNSIQYLAGPPVGATLLAECKATKMGRRLGFYTTEVRDKDNGKLYAIMEGTCCRA